MLAPSVGLISVKCLCKKDSSLARCSTQSSRCPIPLGATPPHPHRLPPRITDGVLRCSRRWRTTALQKSPCSLAPSPPSPARPYLAPGSSEGQNAGASISSPAAAAAMPNDEPSAMTSCSSSSSPSCRPPPHPSPSLTSGDHHGTRPMQWWSCP
jgi:hypothetical protein